MVEKIEELLLGRRPAAAAPQQLGWRGTPRHIPFIADDKHRLRQVERGKSGVERHPEHRVGERYVVVQKAGALRAEHHPAGLLGGEPGAHFAGRLARHHLAADHATVARGGGIDMDEVADRRGDTRIEPRLVEHAIGPACRRHRLFRRPAVARAHQPQIVERAIHHRPRRGADFSPSCGSTRMIAGPPAVPCRRWSVPAI